MKDSLGPESDPVGRVLLVDDAPELRRAIGRDLRALGHSVVEVDRARTALELAANRSFDAILSDVMMPEMCGLELLMELRRRGISVPVVLMSAAPNPHVAEKAAACGASDYLAKPLGLDVLCFSIARALERSRLVTRSYEHATHHGVEAASRSR